MCDSACHCERRIRRYQSTNIQKTRARQQSKSTKPRDPQQSSRNIPVYARGERPGELQEADGGDGRREPSRDEPLALEVLPDKEEGKNDGQDHEEKDGDEHVVRAHDRPGVLPPARVVVVDGLVPGRGVPQAAMDHHGHGRVELLDPRHALPPEGALPDDGRDAEDAAERDEIVGGDVDLFCFCFWGGGVVEGWRGIPLFVSLVIDPSTLHAAIPRITQSANTTHQPHAGA